MTESDLIGIERLLSDFGWYADRADGDSLAQLFLPEAVLIVSGLTLVGHKAIADDCRRRQALDPQRKTRHLWSNLRVQSESDGAAEGVAIQVTYEQSGDATTKMRISDLIDQYQRDATGVWRFRNRTIARQMALEL